MFITPEDGARIVDELKAAIGRDVNIMDRTGTIVASTDPSRVGKLHAGARQLIQARLPVLEISKSDEMAGVQEGINLPIQVNGVLEGVIGITGPADSVRIFGTIAKKMTEILLNSLRQQEQQALLSRAKNLLLEEWLFARELDWPTLSARAALLGIDAEQPRRAALLTYAGYGPSCPSKEFPSGPFLQRIEARFRGDSQTLWTVVNQRLLLLFSGRAMEQARQILEEICRKEDSLGTKLVGGLSSPSRGMADLRRCYQEAKIAARAAAWEGSIREYSSASLDFVLQNLDPQVKRDILQAVFPPGPEADDPELLECLRLYFQFDGRVDQAADFACVHPNTFRYRMEKLHRITGYDLRRPRDSAMLYLALLFWEEADR